MSTDTQQLAVTTAVYLGAVILIGLPVTFVLSTAMTEVIEGFDPELVDAELLVAGVFLVSLVIGLQLAVEAAALQLGGVAALNRGGPRMALIRHVALAVGVVIALTVVAFWAIAAAIDTPDWTIIVLGALVAVAALAVLYRFSSAFTEGYRSRTE